MDIREELAKQEALEAYQLMLYSRRIEEKMLSYLRQGKISKWFSGIGQEAISVGAVLSLQENEFILPMHRNLAVFLGKKIPLSKLYAQWQGKREGFTKGRERSFHFGSLEHHVIGMISHLGPQLSVACGLALWHKIHKEEKAVLVFTGEGATSEGDFHEALNLASVWELPVIFLIENNGYALSTPTTEQYKCENLTEKGSGYGIEAFNTDGNNCIEISKLLKELVSRSKAENKPFLVEAMTFRMRGHEEASGTKYVPQELFEEWAKKDPLLLMEEDLRKKSWLNDVQKKAMEDLVEIELKEELKKVEGFNSALPSVQEELFDVFSPTPSDLLTVGLYPVKSESNKEGRFIDAIKDGMREALLKFPDLVFMGQDIAEYGGAFKATEGFVEEFGKERIRNTPLCESAVLGTALGYSLAGGKSMVEMQFSDFVTCGFNQIVNNLAKVHYRWGAKADVVIRMPCGGTVGAGPFHSQTNEAWFFHVPGLKIVYPSSVYDAKVLLLAAFLDPNPVLFFEHKSLYRKLSGEYPEGFCVEELGKAKIVKEGNSLSVITYGIGVHWALELVKEYKDELKSDREYYLENELEILDLRTLSPLDWEGVYASVRKTGKALVLHEANLTGGVGAELVARITENCFQALDAPVIRCASLDTPVPFAEELENQFMAKSVLREKIDYLLAY